MSPRVAMIGSCVTRDIWSLPMFTPADRKALFVLARTSLASLFTAPHGDFSPPDPLPPGLSRFEIRMIGYDLRKTGLAELVAHQPTHLILDVIDERFDLLARDETVATYSWDLELLGAPQGELADYRRIPRRSDAAHALWRRGLAELAGFLARELPDTQVILHEARCATERLDLEGRRGPMPEAWPFWPGHAWSIADQNAAFDAYLGELRAAFPQALRLRAPDELTLADDGHRWGLAPFHYVEDYYRWIWRELEALGLRAGG